MSTFLKFILALSFSAFLIGCDKGPAEEAGEDIDEAMEDVREGVDDATD